MYPEFIAIYIGLAVLIALGIAILVILIKQTKNNDGFTSAPSNDSFSFSQQVKATNKNGGNMAFCKKCATQFDASEKCCPKCGTPR